MANGYVRGPNTTPTASHMEENLGYYNSQVQRNAAGVAAVGDGGTLMLMKFKIASCGLLNQDKFLPVFGMPLTIQLRLSDVARATSKSMAAYTITRPRMHCQMLSVS